MPRLTDLQAILLTHAAQRDGGDLLPLPAVLTESAAKVPAAIASLIKRGLAQQRETNDPAVTYRIVGDVRFAAVVTPTGLAAINIAVDDDAAPEPMLVPPASPIRVSKSASVVALLKRGDGATLAELIAATGWLPHTTRAALTGLRKKGHAIERDKRGEVTCYRITGVA